MELKSLKRLEDVEKRAMKEMSKLAKAYFSAEAGGRENRKVNERALKRYRILPRVFRDVSHVQTETTLLSSKTTSPIAAAPTGFHHLAHPAAENAVSFACAKEGLIMAASFVSSSSMEEIAEVAPHSPKWLQIYICDDRNITRDIIKRAEKSGFTALIVTVDAPVKGLWKNYVPDNFPQILQGRAGNRLSKPISLHLDPSLTSEGIRWLKSLTKLPIVAKGIMRGEDAIEAARQGASAIVVSNHGARQIDGVCSTIDVLEEVVKAVKPYDVEVYLDGGIRTGSDIFRALALGAKAVFIGRPIVWGLSIGFPVFPAGSLLGYWSFVVQRPGFAKMLQDKEIWTVTGPAQEEGSIPPETTGIPVVLVCGQCFWHQGKNGVRRVLEILKDEFRTTMCLAGAASLEEITREMIVKENNFSRL